MNKQFQHVMVLTFIIIGLGLSNALLGLNAAIAWPNQAMKRTADRPYAYIGEHANITCNSRGR